jgi:hypothetical protein
MYSCLAQLVADDNFLIIGNLRITQTNYFLRMQCSCGCNQVLSRRQIQRHLRKQVVPRLVAAAVAQFQTLGRTVSAPRMNPSRKQRSSRRYLPSSLESFDDNEIVVDQPHADRDSDMEVDSEEKSDVDELAVLRAIGRAQQGVWSGRRAAVESEGEESEGDDDDGDDEDENQEDSKDEDHEYWEEYDDLEGPTGLSALD